MSASLSMVEREREKKETLLLESSVTFNFLPAIACLFCLSQILSSFKIPSHCHLERATVETATLYSRLLENVVSGKMIILMYIRVCILYTFFICF